MLFGRGSSLLSLDEDGQLTSRLVRLKYLSRINRIVESKLNKNQNNHGRRWSVEIEKTLKVRISSPCSQAQLRDHKFIEIWHATAGRWETDLQGSPLNLMPSNLLLQEADLCHRTRSGAIPSFFSLRWRNEGTETRAWPCHVNDESRLPYVHGK